MLQRGADGARPSLALARVARTGGHVFETLGRFRWQSRNASRDRTWQLRGERLQRVTTDLCRVHGFDLRIDGVLPNRPAVLVANHVSYVDAMVIPSLAPCTVIAKGEVRGWPFVGAGAAALGILFVERGNAWSGARALRQGLRALEAGISVLGFPEGTTTRGDDVLPFRRGLFGLAQIAGVPIVPIALHYISPELRWYGDSWFVPHYLRTAMRPSSLVRIRVGASIAPTELFPAEELAQRARSSIRSMLWRVRA
jgi:1-acyl-sn-glycerol-3-phosphate acyltransferase